MANEIREELFYAENYTREFVLGLEIGIEANERAKEIGITGVEGCIAVRNRAGSEAARYVYDRVSTNGHVIVAAAYGARAAVTNGFSQRRVLK